MNLHGAGSPLSSNGFSRAQALVGVDAATLWAVLDVETRRFGFLPSRRPVIAFERHLFHRLTGGRFDRDYPALSSPVPGGHKGGAAEYAKLNGAAMLDRDAALQSTSWGIGQLMGLNFAQAGYTAVPEIPDAMVSGEDEQLRAMAACVLARDMTEALQRQDWSGFAHRYNGSDNGREGYDVKLAAAYARYRQWLPSFEVRSVQVALVYLGISPGPVDGVIGPRTIAAIMAFQRKRRVRVTGRLDSRLEELLVEATLAA